MPYSLGLEKPDVITKFRSHGFDTVRDVKNIANAEQFRVYLDKRSGIDDTSAGVDYNSNFRRAKHLAAGIQAGERSEMSRANPGSSMVKSVPVASIAVAPQSKSTGIATGLKSITTSTQDVNDADSVPFVEPHLSTLILDRFSL